MALEKLADYLYVSKQLNERLAKQAAQYEIKTVICNRPDGEEPGQPDFETVRGWLQAAGIENVVYLPVTMDSINDQLLEEFRETVAKSPAPILAYCRSGTRSSFLWAMGQAAQGADPRQLLQTAAAAGIDLTAALPRLQEAQA